MVATQTKTDVSYDRLASLFLHGGRYESKVKLPEVGFSTVNRAIHSCPYIIEFDSSLEVCGKAMMIEGGKARFIVLNTSFSLYEILTTLVHEWTHQILHLGRKMSPSIPLWQKELEAEATAFVVMNELGFQATDSICYIAEHIPHRVRTKELQEVFSFSKGRVLTAARMILQEMDL